MKRVDVHSLTQDILSLSLDDDVVEVVMSYMPAYFANSVRVSDKVAASMEAGRNNHWVLYHDVSSSRPTSLSPRDVRALLGELQQCFFCHLECFLQYFIDHLEGKVKKVCSFSYENDGVIHNALCSDDAATPYNALCVYFKITSTDKHTNISCELDLDLGNDEGKLALIDNIVHCCYAHQAITKAKMQQMKREAFDDGDCDDDGGDEAMAAKRRRTTNDDDDNNNKEE